MKVDQLRPNVELSRRDPIGLDSGSNFYSIVAKIIKDATSLMRDIKRKTRRKFSSKENLPAGRQGSELFWMGIIDEKSPLLLNFRKDTSAL